MKTLVVLGSESFIGRHVVKYFEATSVSHKDLDLTKYDKVKEYFDDHPEIEYVVLCSTVGRNRQDDPVDTVEQNLRMFVNVTKFADRFKKVFWFSSGADSSSRYGFSKHIMEMLSVHEKNITCLRIYGCFGVGELSTRFLSTCVREGHVNINQDRYFDFFYVNDVCRVIEYCINNQNIPWRIDLVYNEKYKLSQFAEMIGSTYHIDAETTNEYTGIRGQIELTFQPMSLLLQKFREDYIHNLHLQESSRDAHQEEIHRA